MKNILLGLLVAYVVMDLLVSMLARRKHPSLLEKVMENLDEENVMMACVIGVLAGILTWYLASNSKEMYTSVDDE